MSESKNRLLRVFLGHSPRDQSIARELYRRLKAEGWMDVWFIETRLLPSQDWDVEIRKGVENTDVVIILHSERSIEKENYFYPGVTFVLDLLHGKPSRSVSVIALRLDDHMLIDQKIWRVVDYFPKSRRESAYQGLLENLKHRAEQLDLSLSNQVSDPEPENRLVWSPSNWKNQNVAKTGGVVEDKLPSLRANRKHLNLKKGIFGGTNKIQSYFAITGTLLILLICGQVMKNFVESRLEDLADAPILSEALTLLPFPAPTLGVGSIATSPEDGMRMVYVPSGEFIMGSEIYFDERPIHAVNLSGFWIDQTEVTNAMFALFITKEGNREEDGVTWLDAKDENARIHLADASWQAEQGYEDYPVVEVTWYGAKAYCSWANRRLPTEAEWEKAARGVSGNIFPWGNNDPNGELLNFNNENDSTTRTGSYAAGVSPYGALDMAGNAWEWVADRYSRTYYASSPLVNPAGPDSGVFRVLRGGAWRYRDTYARSSHRNRGIPTISHDFIGFRCASSASQ